MTSRLACALSLALLAFTACEGSDGPVGPGGYGPGGYEIGAVCRSNYDCATGFCCVSPPCHGGMCSYACRADPDCPYGARCDGGVCFWACATDYDCALGQTCKKGHTVCQY